MSKSIEKVMVAKPQPTGGGVWDGGKFTDEMSRSTWKFLIGGANLLNIFC